MSRHTALRLTPIAAVLLALPGIAMGQLAGAAAAPMPLDPTWGFSLAPQLEEHVLPPGQGGSTHPLAETVKGNIGRDVTLTGDAELRGHASVVKGDKLHYDQDSDRADANGNVVLVNNGNSFAGPQAELYVEANVGYMLSPTYHFGSTSGYGQGQRIELLDPDRSIIFHGTYTACQCDDPAWYVRSSELKLDNGSGIGVAHNATLFFQNVPLFYSPWMQFPLTEARQSGLLPPTVAVGTSTGLDITAPYYFNLAPNRDLTLLPRYMALRGFQLSANYRYLSPTYAGTITLQDLPHDMITNTDRYAIFLQHNQSLGYGFAAYANYNRVSDSTYTEDLGNINTTTVGAQTLFQQEAGLTYSNGPWSGLARVQTWQVLPPSSTAPPYSRSPQLNVKYQKYDVGGFDFGAEADFTRFSLIGGGNFEGSRVYVNPYVSYSINKPGFFFTPMVQWHLASYNITSVPAGTPANQSRNPSVSIPTYSIDTGMVFERPIKLFGNSYIQTLEPRVFYVYTPFVNQSMLPVYDTDNSDFGLAEIFTTNTFVGNDRIADGERLTTALTTRFLEAANGDERARFVIAQQYYFIGQRTTLPGQTLGNVSHSDILTGASLVIGGGLATQNAIQYNPNNSQLVRSNFGVAWSPGDHRVINVAYRYTATATALDNDVPVKQVVASYQWPLTRRLSGVGRVNYALDSHRLVDGLIGFQYDAPSWIFSMGVQHYANGVDISNSTSTGTRYLAQLQLKGFARVDNGLTAAFVSGIPGYQPPPPPPPPLARFSNYQ